MKWEERRFTLIPHCFQQHFDTTKDGEEETRSSLVINVFGQSILHWEESGEIADFNFAFRDNLPDEAKNCEVVGSDAQWKCKKRRGNCLTVIAGTEGKWCVTIRWANDNECGQSASEFFLTVLDISFSSTEAIDTLLAKIDLQNAVVLCRFVDYHDKDKNQHKGLLYFQCNQNSASLRKIQNENSEVGVKCVVKEDYSLKEVYAELHEFDSLRGSVISMSTVTLNGYRWTCIGTDTGYIVIYVTDVAENKTTEVRRLLFACSITVLEVWSLDTVVSDKVPEQSEESSPSRACNMAIVVSSALGTVSILRAHIKDGWDGEAVSVEWRERVRLDGGEGAKKREIVTDHARSNNLLLIATYGNTVDAYDLSGLSDATLTFIDAVSSFSMRSPVSRIAFTSERSLSVLTSAGQHDLHCTSLTFH